MSKSKNAAKKLNVSQLPSGPVLVYGRTATQVKRALRAYEGSTPKKGGKARPKDEAAMANFGRVIMRAAKNGGLFKVYKEKKATKPKAAASTKATAKAAV